MAMSMMLCDSYSLVDSGFGSPPVASTFVS